MVWSGSGETLAYQSPEDGNVADQLWDDWSFPLHTGDFAGPVGRVAWTLLALAPLAMGATGVVMQVIRRRKRSRRADVGPAVDDGEPVAIVDMLVPAAEA